MTGGVPVDQSWPRPLPPIRGGEDVSEVLIIDAQLNDGQLIAANEVIHIPERGYLPRLLLSPESTPDDYEPVGGGVAFAYIGHGGTPLERRTMQGIRIDALGDGRFRWIYPVRGEKLLIILLLPDQHTADDYQPFPVGAKAFRGRVAIYWRFSFKDDPAEIVWHVTPSGGDLRADVERVNAGSARLSRERDQFRTVLTQFLDTMQRQSLVMHVGELTLGDHYDISGQVGAAGRGAATRDSVFIHPPGQPEQN